MGAGHLQRNSGDDVPTLSMANMITNGNCVSKYGMIPAGPTRRMWHRKALARHPFSVLKLDI